MLKRLAAKVLKSINRQTCLRSENIATHPVPALTRQVTEEDSKQTGKEKKNKKTKNMPSVPALNRQVTKEECDKESNLSNKYKTYKSLLGITCKPGSI